MHLAHHFAQVPEEVPSCAASSKMAGQPCSTYKVVACPCDSSSMVQHSRDLPKMAAQPCDSMSELQHAHGFCSQSLEVSSSPNLFPYPILAFLVTGALSWGAGQFLETGKSPQPFSRGLPAPRGWNLTTGSFSPIWAHQNCNQTGAHPRCALMHDPIITVERNRFLFTRFQPWGR